MKQNTFSGLLYNPTLRVVATWIWWLVGAVLTVLMIVAIQGIPLSSATSILGEKRYLAVYIEMVSVGLLPVVFTLLCRDDLTQYGLTSKGWGKSLSYSLLFVAAMFTLAYLTRGRLMTDDRPPLHLDFPWNLWYALLGIFAWGPLEVFFVVWLIANTDRIFKDEDRLISWGLLITVAGFGLLHVVTTSAFNAFYTGSIFFILTLIYKHTRNALGPMLAWTLINGQVWYIARMLS